MSEMKAPLKGMRKKGTRGVEAADSSTELHNYEW